MRMTLFRCIGAITVLLTAPGTQAALLSVAGGQAVYDTDLDLTWVSDANLAASNTFGLPTGVNLGPHPLDPSGVGGIIHADGTITWSGALFWIDAMNAANYLGASDWRLPITPQPDPTCDIQTGDVPPLGLGKNCTGSEMGHLYNIEGVTFATPGLFSNVQAPSYWSETEYLPSALPRVWVFRFTNGSQGQTGSGNGLRAWAVRSGNIGVVPVPAAVWLFGSGLLGLAGLTRRSRKS